MSFQGPPAASPRQINLSPGGIFLPAGHSFGHAQGTAQNIMSTGAGHGANVPITVASQVTFPKPLTSRLALILLAIHVYDVLIWLIDISLMVKAAELCIARRQCQLFPKHNFCEQDVLA